MKVETRQILMHGIIIQIIKQSHIPYIPEHAHFTLTLYQQLIPYPIIITPSNDSFLQT